MPVALDLLLKMVITINSQKETELSGIGRTGNCLAFSGSFSALPFRDKETEAL